jgi:DMSO/TMAO reductase YedYZ molybdopterin-dependent catalytic subunit
MSLYAWALAPFRMSEKREAARLSGDLIAIALMAMGLAAGSAAQGAPQATTSVTVTGNVADSLSLAVTDLNRYPARQIEYALRNSADDKVAAPMRRYTGVLLRDVLASAKPTESKPRQLRRSYVVATASDGYEVVFSWAELFVSPVGESVFVVYERDGVPLGDDEGSIALIATTDIRPVRHVKWLQRLTLRGE